ncbi:TIGR01777 family protein [Haemophilus paracuniculus]|uniref:TIGR01777 family protein n=1 Tax=Haemophilus paracuniculus TaxID=734 RepID=A0A1T0AQR8_9PAST|nr:TIGR01777 family oxidoreductase [Haemophilus paracuniculus]OOR98473.1 TIGR01777 family protein [Haemophilus paracuniculus]
MAKRILITGGTGFIGKALVEKLLAKGDQITILSRQNLVSDQVRYIQNLNQFKNLNEFDAVINLAGEPIFAKRWTAKQKAILRSSRIDLTAQLADLIEKSDNPPKVFLSGSATGFYGDLPQSAKFFDEQTACGTGFAASLCHEWEQTALRVASETRVCLLRTGLVMDKSGGALKAMLPLYRWGLGGKLGSGEQHWAWIALADYLQAVEFLLENAQCEGAFNLAAPHPATNAEFNRLLAHQLNRPAFCHAPAFALKLLLGERSQLLLNNQSLVPQRLLEQGFIFQYPQLPTFDILN